jgi:hypothetical protein
MPRRDIKILKGDLNATVGDKYIEYETVKGRHGLGIKNELCRNNDLVSGGTIFLHKTYTKQHEMSKWIHRESKRPFHSRQNM